MLSAVYSLKVLLKRPASKQCGPRSDCSFKSSLIRVYTVCLYAEISLWCPQLNAANELGRWQFYIQATYKNYICVFRSIAINIWLNLYSWFFFWMFQGTTHPVVMPAAQNVPRETLVRRQRKLNAVLECTALREPRPVRLVRQVISVTPLRQLHRLSA